MAEEQDDFNQQIITAVEEREKWYNTVQLPKIQENYRLHLTCVRNLFDAMVKRSLITPDPYKSDKKITDIVCPDSSDFTENEKQMVLGTRLSDYESMLDYICNYMRFSVDQLTMDKIRKLMEFNGTFGWANISLNANKVNTRTLAGAINSLKQGAPQLTLSLIKDSTLKSGNAIKEINEVLKSLAEFHRERYKAEIRRTIFFSSQFDKQKAYSSGNAMFTEIKRLFPTLLPKKSFSAEPVNEIVAEELGSDCQERRLKLLKNIKVEEEKSKNKVQKVDTKELVMEVVRVMGGLNDQYTLIYEKIATNHKILQDEKNSFGARLARFFRKLIGASEPDVEYEILIADKNTDAKKREKIKYNEFMESLSKRIKYYASFCLKNSPGYLRIYNQEESVIADFLNRQITENNHLFAQFVALDAYFKKTVQGENKLKVKGILMELTTVKNILVKVRQLRAEYVAYIEEQEQMKKLGILNEA